MRMRSLITALAMGGMLQACSMMPTYEQPAAPTPSAWPQGEAYAPANGGEGMAVVDIGWRDFFRDPALQHLIGMALDNNRDLRTAALRVDAYRAQYRIQRAALFPALDIDGGGTRQRLPADLSGTGYSRTSGNYSIGFGVTAYELDLFGRVRSLEQQALEEYFASEETRRSTQLTLVSDVATAWLTLRSDTALLELTRDTLRAYEESLALIVLRNEAGTASLLDVTQARSAVEGARSQEAQYLRLIALDTSALQWLVGASLPDELVSGSKKAPIEESLLAEIPVGLPADVMQRRPDILAAEHRLKGANANIGAARAAFFPSVTLTASAGTASNELSGLFDAGSGAWSFIPKINIPIFNAGRLRANLDYAEIQKDINVAEYEKTIQTAFREVSDGLAARKTYRQQLQAEYDLVNTNRQYLDLADRRYRAGVDNYLTVLDAQRELFTAEQQRIRSRLNQLNGEIALYKALGGGDWATAH